MKSLIIMLTFAGLSALGIAQAQAAAGDLAKCYDRVISSCNKGNHAESCSGNGMNQCDKLHPTPFVSQQLKGFSARP